MEPRPADDEIELRCRVRPREAGVSLLEFLARRFRYEDRAQWTARIAAGKVTVDGRLVDPNTVLRVGATVRTLRVLAEPPAPTDVRIVYDVEDLLVVDKPAGLPFHADGAFLTRTLVGVLARTLSGRLEPLQRLDRETSGLCLFARTREVARAVRAQIEAGTVAKVYTAIVRGRIELAQGSLCDPIGSAPGSAVSLRRAVLPQGTLDARAARTDFEVLARSDAASLVRCRLYTGRTHQIRVHMEGFGHPVVGDKLYGRTDADYLAWVAHVKAGGDVAFDGRFGAPRQMLHAASVALTSPTDGRALEFTAPWPADFVQCAEALGVGCATDQRAGLVTPVRTIYVQLLDEGTQCWRPVDAVMIRPGVFRIVSIQPDPQDERWEFGSGQDVACQERELDDDGECHLVAVHAVTSTD